MLTGENCDKTTEQTKIKPHQCLQKVNNLLTSYTLWWGQRISKKKIYIYM